MRSRFVVRAILSTLFLASAAAATERVEGPRDRIFSGPPTKAAWTYLQSEQGPGEVRGTELVLKSELRGVEATTVRFEQVFHGLPVVGASAAVRIGMDGRVHFTTIHGVGELSVSTKPLLSAQEAEALVASTISLDASKVRTRRLAVKPGDEETPGGYLVWEVDASSRLGGERFWVDALRGRVVGRRVLASDVLGRVYKVNSKATPKPSDEPLLDLDDANPRKLNAYNGDLAIYQYKSGGEQSPFVGTQDTVPNSGEDFLFDPPASEKDKTDEFALINSYYHIHRIRQFYTTTLKIDMSGSDWSLGVVANALDGGAPLDNAFFSAQGISEPYHPNLIAIGQGGHDFAYDSDVFMHEFSHYVSENAIGYNEGQFSFDNYGTSAFGGSIDEGIADYFACTVNEDPLLGEAVLGPYTRNLAYNDGRRCPEDLFGETHEDGKILGNAAWEIRSMLGAELSDQLIWAGFSMLTKGASLQDFAENVTKSAQEMVTSGKITDTQFTKIKKIFDDRGLFDCGRVLSLNTGDRQINMIGLEMLGQYFGAGCNQLKKFVELSSPFHFSYKPEAGAKKIRFEIALDPTFGNGSMDWRLLVRKNKPVSFKPSQNGFPEVSKFDIDFGNISDNDGSFEIGEGTPYELDPDATYYAVLAYTNCPYTKLTFEAFSDFGSAGNAGAAGTGGAGGTGGVGGTGGASAGSSGAGKGGAGGKAGASHGGSGGFSLGGAGGSSTNGNSVVEGVMTPEGGGCGCRTTGSSPSKSTPLGGVGLALALLVRRARIRQTKRN